MITATTLWRNYFSDARSRALHLLSWEIARVSASTCHSKSVLIPDQIFCVSIFYLLYKIQNGNWKTLATTRNRYKHTYTYIHTHTHSKFRNNTLKRHTKLRLFVRQTITALSAVLTYDVQTVSVRIIKLFQSLGDYNFHLNSEIRAPTKYLWSSIKLCPLPIQPLPLFFIVSSSLPGKEKSLQEESSVRNVEFSGTLIRCFLIRVSSHCSTCYSFDRKQFTYAFKIDS
jgi:hypothetical protein